MKKLSIIAGVLTYSFMNCTLAGTMNVYKDSRGQVLLSNVIDKNGQPQGTNFKNFTNLIKSTQYDSKAKSKSVDPKVFANATPIKDATEEIRRNVEDASYQPQYTSKNSNRIKSSNDTLISKLDYVGTNADNITIYMGNSNEGPVLFFDGSETYGEANGLVISKIKKSNRASYSSRKVNNLNEIQTNPESIKSNVDYLIDCERKLVLSDKNEAKRLWQMSPLHQETAKFACDILKDNKF